MEDNTGQGGGEYLWRWNVTDTITCRLIIYITKKQTLTFLLPFARHAEFLREEGTPL